MRKKLLAIIATLAMVMTMIPSVTFATDVTAGSVAEVNGVEYDTLQNAFDAAINGDTVKILKDIELSLDDMDSQFVSSNSKVYWTWSRIYGKNLILDLDGHKISFADDVIKYPSAGTYDGKDYYEEDFYRLFMLNDGATLTVTGNGTIDCHDKSTYIFNLSPKATGSILNIQNGTYYAETIVENYSKGAQNYCNVYSGMFKAAECTDGRYDPNFIFNLNGTSSAHGFAVYGGTFVDIDPNKMTDGDAVADGYKSVDNGDKTWTVTASSPVAEVKYTDYMGSYTTLQDAFNAVPKDGTETTVTLLTELALETADMTKVTALKSNAWGKYTNYFAAYLVGNQNAVLDMNGKSLFLTYDDKYSPEDAIYGGSGLIGVLEGAQLTITGNGAMNITGYGVADVWSCSIGSKVTIENGMFTSGTVKNQSEEETPNLTYASHGGELYIKGGTFKTGYYDKTIQSSVAIVKDMACADRTEYGNNGALTVVEVTGGTFWGVDPDSNCPQRNADYAWTDVDVVPDGYKSIDNGNNTWTVVKVSSPSSGTSDAETNDVEQEVVTDVAEDTNVETGDSMNMALPITVAGLALAAMAAVVATRRRHN